MKQLLFLLILFTCSTSQLMAQTGNVGIGTTMPDPSAALEIMASDKGLLIPRMTSVERSAIINPAIGLSVFDTDENGFYYYDGSKWLYLGLPTDGNLNDILRADATGNATWQPLIDPDQLELPSPDLSEDGTLALADALSIAVQGDYAYVTIDDLAGSTSFQVINVSDSNNPSLSGSLAIGSAYNMVVQDNYAYLIANNGGSNTLEVINISDPNNPIASGSFPIGISFDLQVQGSFAYLLIDDGLGSNNLEIIDVSDPGNMTSVGSYAIGSGFGLVIQGNYAYTLKFGSSGSLEIVDISDPTNPTSIGSLALDSPGFVSVQGNYAYVALDDGSGTTSLEVIDVTDPSNPVQNGSILTTGFVNYMEVQGSYAYMLLEDGIGDTKLVVANVSDPNSPSLSGTPFDLGTSAPIMAVQGSYAYVLAGELKIIQLSELSAVGMNLNGDLASFNLPDPQVGANTLNYLPKWNGTELVKSESVFEDASGNMGIGTSNPRERLEVSGTVQTDGLTLPTGAFLDHVLKSDATGKATWQPLIDPDQLELPSPDLSEDGTLALADALSIAVQGDYAYVTIDDFAGSTSFQVINVSDSNNPSLSASLAIGSAYNMVVQDNYAYLIANNGGSNTLEVINISDPNNPIASGSFPIGISFDLQVQGSFAYLLIDDGLGSNNLEIIDVSDPGNMTSVGSYAIGSGFGLVIQGNYAYTLKFGSSGSLEIVDISDPTNPTSIGSLALDSPGFVSVQGNYAYVALDDGSGTTSLEVIDVTDPSNPVQNGSILTTGFVNYMEVQGSYAYMLLEDGIGDTKLVVANVSDPNSPSLSGTPFDLGTSAPIMAVQGSYAYVLAGELKIIQLSELSAVGMNLNGDLASFNLPDPQVGANTLNYLPKWNGTELVKSESVFEDASGNMGIGTSNPRERLEVSGTVQTDGLTLPTGAFLDHVLKSDATGKATWQPLIDPDQLELPSPDLSEDGTLALADALSIAVQGDYAYVTIDDLAGSTSFQVINVSDSNNPSLSGSLAIGSAYNMVVQDNYAYLIANNGGSNTLEVINISDPNNPIASGSFPIGISFDLQVQGSFAYLLIDDGLGSNNLEIIDVSDPGNMTSVGSYAIGSGFGLVIQGNYAYTLKFGSSGSLEIVDISDPTNPTSIGSLALDSPGFVSVQGNYAYVALDDGSGTTSLEVIDVTDPSNPVQNGSILTTGFVNYMEVQGSYAYMLLEDGIGDTKLVVANVSDPNSPSLSGTPFDLGTSAPIMAVQGSYAYVLAGELKIIQLSELSAVGMNLNGDLASFNLPDPQVGANTLNYLPKWNGTELVKSESVFEDASGNVGIGRTPMTNVFEVEGEASKTTPGSWVGNSDARLKKEIQPLNSDKMLQRLLDLQGVTYEWNDDKTDSKRPEGVQFGFIAQNIQEVFPTLVEEDKLGYLQTAYGTYDAMTVEAIRALNDKIEKLKTENKQQLSMISNLHAELSEMEQMKIENQSQKAETDDLKQRMTKLEAALLGSKNSTQKITEE